MAQHWFSASCVTECSPHTTTASCTILLITTQKLMARDRIILTGLLLTLAVDNATAVESLFPLSRPSDQRPDILEEQQFKPKATPKLELPSIPPPGQQNKQISQILKFQLKGYRFSGNTVYSNAQLIALVEDYAGKEIDTLDILQIKNLITKHYIDNGYINSGAIIPDQEIQDGILDIHIIEGELTEIRVTNKGRLRDKYISDRIRLDMQKPFNFYILQKRLYLLQQNPRIKTINANLGPGAEKGESILDINIAEEKPYKVLVQADNYRPPSVGEAQGTIRFQYLDITGFGDSIDATINHTEGFDRGYINYQWPLTADDKLLYFAYENSQSKIVSDDVKELGLDLKNDSETATIGFTFPAYRAITETYDVSLQLDKRESTTYINGTPTSYAGSGAINGVSKISVLRLIQNWFKFDATHAYAFRHILSVGMEAFDSTQHDDGEPDSEFVAWLFQFQAALQNMGGDLQTVLRADCQFAFDDLMPMEQIAVGGANTVRGYRENLFVSDSGFIASAELRKAVYKSDSGKHLVQFAIFSDYGRTWPYSGPIDPESIYSVGAGLRWQWNHRAQAEFYWGYPLVDISTPDDGSLQDKGIYLKFAAYFP